MSAPAPLWQPFVQPSLDLPAIAELASAGRRWVCWKPEQRAGQPKPTKVPVKPNGRNAQSNNPKTWGLFEACCVTAEAGRHGIEGVGFVFHHEDGAESYRIGIDLDGCRDPETGELTPLAKAIADRLNSYTEVSPSGRGVHIFVRGRIETAGKRNGQIECYAKGRYFTVTGRRLEQYPDEITSDQAALDWFWWTHLRGDPKAGNGHDHADGISPDRQERGAKAQAGDEVWFHLASGRPVLRSEAIHPDPANFPWDLFKALSDNDQLFKRTWERKRKDLENTLSHYDMALAVRVLMVRWTRPQVAALIQANRRRQGDADKGERVDYITRTILTAEEWVAKGRGDDRELVAMLSEAAAEAKSADGKPVILVTPRLGNAAVEQAAALLRDKVFVRFRTPMVLTHAAELAGTKPVKDPAELHPDDDPATVQLRGVRYGPETLVLDRLSTARAEMELDERARFQKLNAAGKSIDIFCPEVVSGRIVAGATELGFLPIMGLAATPLFLDGVVIDSPGYHAPTGMYVCWSGPPLDLPRAPTRDDALALLPTLLEPFTGYKGAVAEEGLLAAQMTAVLRASLETSPATVVDANQPRAGKSKIARALATFGAGHRRWTSIPDGHSQEEFEKRIDAAVIGSAPTVILENIRSVLRSPTLESILTEGMVDIRRFGKNDELIKVEQRTNFIATLNQARIGRDMLGRIIPLRIVVLDEKPHLRPFPFDPVAVARAKRFEIVRACLIIARAWRLAWLADPKRRAKLRVLGSFEEWSWLVAGAVEWLIGKSPIDLTVQRQESDTEENAAGELLEALARVFKDQEFTAGEFEAMAGTTGSGPPLIDRDLLHSVVIPKGAETMVAAIGQWLAANLETPRRGLVLVRRNHRKGRYAVASNLA